MIPNTYNLTKLVKQLQQLSDEAGRFDGVASQRINDGIRMLEDKLRGQLYMEHMKNFVWGKGGK